VSPHAHISHRENRDEPSVVRRDLKYLWADARYAGPTMKHRPDPEVEAASAAPGDVVDRIETELAGEAMRFRYALYASIAAILAPVLLSWLAWSALYWLPVTVFWFPFERGYYGLPWLSLYEWMAYLLLALFFAFGFALVAESHGAVRRLSADYRRLASADDAERRAFVAAIRDGGLARTELVLRGSGVFSEYVGLLDEAAASVEASASVEAPA
jgi:hypothetical protein